MDNGRRSKAESGAVARADDLTPTYTDKAGNVHKKRILTGDRTTGKLHLGHYVGSLKNRVKLQRDYDTFILMADVQALTTHWENPKILRESVRDVALDYLAAGLDPYTGGEDDGTKTKIVVQSAVPAIAELTVLYGLVVPMSLLEQNPTTKAEAEQHGYGQVFTDVDPQKLKRESDAKWISEIEDEGFSYLEQIQQLVWEKFPELKEEIGVIGIQKSATSMYQNLKQLDVSTQEVIKKFGNSPWKAAASGDMTVLRELQKHIKRHLRTIGRLSMTYGFLGYPVSQAADITFVNAHLVPVGEDQVPHIELTREIARRINKQYGKRKRVLTIPQALIGGGGILKALDGSAKMSKSLGNAIYLSDDDKSIWAQIKRAVTDPQRVRRDDPGRPEICNVFAYHQHFNSATEPSIAAAGVSVDGVSEMSCDEVAASCRSAKIGCVECKKQLAAKLTALLDPIRERRAAWEPRMDDVMDILAAGTRRGCEEGNATVERLKSAMHVDYWK